MRITKSSIVPIVLVLLALAIAGVRAEPPFQSSEDLTNALKVVVPHKAAYEVDSNITMHFHVYNSTGYLVTSGHSCYLHVYDNLDRHLFQRELTVSGNDYETYLDNLSRRGEYPYVAWCNGTQAGYSAASFVVTETGETESYDWQIGIAMLVIGVLGFLVVMSMVIDKSNIFMRVAKMFFIMVSFFLTIAIMNLARGFALTNNAPGYITQTLDTLYVADIWVTIFFTAIIIIYFINEVLYAMGWVKGRTFKTI